MKYSVLTLNIWDIPFVMSRDDPERIGIIIDTVSYLKPDLVLLQEAFKVRDRRRISRDIDGYDQEGIYRRRLLNPFFDATGGLVTYTKHPILSSGFHRFRNGGASWDEWFSDKGYTFTSVMTSETRVLCVNNHLSNRKKDTATRQRQLGQVLGHLAEKDTPIIWGGDFNFTKYEGGDLTEEFRMLQDAGFTDSLVGPEVATFSRGNRYTTEEDLEDLGGDSRLDFVFFRGSPSVSVRAVRSQLIGVDQPLSDHYGYLVELELQTSK